MLKYLLIPLADNAVSFCHYESGTHPNRISPDLLRVAIKWAMKENVSVQFIYPTDNLSDDVMACIDEIDHVDIVPYDIRNEDLRENADIVVFDKWEAFVDTSIRKGQSYVIRTSLSDLLLNEKQLISNLIKADRINIVLTDIMEISDEELKSYDALLHRLIHVIIDSYKSEHQVQINILTDRLMLTQMNNCNAGHESIMLASDGGFYACPAFYLSGLERLGDLQNGLNIKNSQLYQLPYAPICRDCDAYQCKRCIWLNQNMTGEVNTPSREQCIMAHMERNASRELLNAFHKISPEFLSEINIPSIDYLDPFDKIINKTN